MKQHRNSKPGKRPTSRSISDAELESLGVPMPSPFGQCDAECPERKAELEEFLAQFEDARPTEKVAATTSAEPEDTGPVQRESAPAQGDAQAAMAALLENLRTVPVPQTTTSMRRVYASPKRIEETLRVVQAVGLTPSGVVHRPDGSTVIEIGAAAQSEVPRKAKGRPWNIKR